MAAPAASDSPGTAARRDRQLAMLWGAASVLLLFCAPLAPRLAELLPACPFKTLTGLPCPGCGTTRAALALARFEWSHAFLHYPLPAAFWVTLLGGGLLAGARVLLARPWRLMPHPFPGWAKAALLAAVLGNWVYSMATGV